MADLRRNRPTATKHGSYRVRGLAAGVLLCCGLASLTATTPIAGAQPAGQGARTSKDALDIHRAKHRELHAKLLGTLTELLRFCEQKGLTDAAARIRRFATPLDTQVLRVDSLPRQVQPDIPPSLSGDERYWQTQLRYARQEYAKELYLLSRRVLHAGYPSYAYHLVREAAFHDPDHKSARRLLGYVRYGDEWVTPFAAQKMRSRYEWHDKFGWLPKSHVARYENGERFVNNRWMPAAQEAEIRRDFNNAWEVRTDHYLVKTNHSLERGVEVALALEEFYQFFFATFAGFFNTPEQMQKLFEGAAGNTTAGSAGKPYEVHYYRTRDEYNERLKSRIPQIAITNGLYYTTDRTCYFYHDGGGENESTLYHEATHQFFYESELRDRPIAEKENFWIIEGIACYMESFQQEDGRLSLGNPRYVRFEAARYRYVQDKYYVPLARFAAMGMQEFQTDPNISKNYSQASGLAHFFMHYDGGRHRDALVEHLSQLYNSRRRSPVATLAELTGSGFAELDRQYGDYLQQLNGALERVGAE